MDTTIAIGISFIALGGLIALANWWNLCKRSTQRFYSTVPLLGAVMLGIGLFLIPSTRLYCWIAIILDYGTLELLAASPNLIHELWSTCRFNLVHEYCGKIGMKTVCLRLFRSRIFTIRLQWHRQAGECGLVDTGTIGKWKREGIHLTLYTQSECAVFDAVHHAPTETLRLSVGFPSWESNPELSLANIDFVHTEGEGQAA